MTTQDAVHRVAEAAAVHPRDIGYAGLKDRHAVTSQWFSLPIRSRPPEVWELPERLQVLEVSAHTNKLRTGHLRGNQFSIALLGVDQDARRRAQAIATFVQAHGMLNSFGAQRFGRGCANLPAALAWLQDGARRRVDRFLLKMYPSVLQSEVFNRYLGLRKELGLDRPLAGEVARLSGSGAMFVVEDPELETVRVRGRSIHLTGPIVGPKMRSAEKQVRELEEQAKLEAGIDSRVEATLARFAPGTRRDLLIFPQSLQLVGEDAGRLRLEVELPAGSYATVLVREFTRAAWHQVDARSPESIDP